MTTERHRVHLCIGLAASIGLLACAGTRPATDHTAVWPPEAVESPGEVVWIGSVSEARPGGFGRFFRAVAGQEQESSKWWFRRPTSVAVHERRMVVIDSGSGVVVWARTDGGQAKILDLPDGFLPVAVAVSHDGTSWFVADGLTGEVRAVSQVATRINEAARLGFKRCILPEASKKNIPGKHAIECISVNSVQNMVDYIFKLR